MRRRPRSCAVTRPTAQPAKCRIAASVCLPVSHSFMGGHRQFAWRSRMAVGAALISKLPDHRIMRNVAQQRFRGSFVYAGARSRNARFGAPCCSRPRAPFISPQRSPRQAVTASLSDDYAAEHVDVAQLILRPLSVWFARPCRVRDLRVATMVIRYSRCRRRVRLIATSSSKSPSAGSVIREVADWTFRVGCMAGLVLARCPGCLEMP